MGKTINTFEPQAGPEHSTISNSPVSVQSSAAQPGSSSSSDEITLGRFVLEDHLVRIKLSSGS
jgi:hypothetical protein